MSPVRVCGCCANTDLLKINMTIAATPIAFGPRVRLANFIRARITPTPSAYKREVLESSASSSGLKKTNDPRNYTTYGTKGLFLLCCFMCFRGSFDLSIPPKQRADSSVRPFAARVQQAYLLLTAISTRSGFAFFFASLYSRAALVSAPDVKSCLPVSTFSQTCERKY